MDHVIARPPDYLIASRHAIATSRSACDTSQALITSSLGLIATAKEVAYRAPQWRAPVRCDECGRAMDSPGVMIVRGRTVVHVACDTAATSQGQVRSA
jgi:hypothetical protein